MPDNQGECDGRDRLELHDTKVCGLELACRQERELQTLALIYTRRSDSRVCRVTLGRYPELSSANARSKAIKLKAEIEDELDPAATIQVRKAAPTFGELAEQ